MKEFDDNQKDKIYDGKPSGKLGSKKNPAIVSVQTKKREKEIISIFEENDWKYQIEVDPHKPEDITQLEQLLHPPKPKKFKKKVGRNEPCPCGSGKKYKKCCGSK